MVYMRKLRVALIAAGLSVLFCFSAFATETESALSLEQLKQQVQETETVINETVESTEMDEWITDNSESKSSIGSIAGAAKLDAASEEVGQIGNVMNSWGAKIMQLLGYIISIGLGIMTALDMVYIAITPLRGVLANGYTGTADTKNKGAQPMGMPAQMMNGAQGPHMGVAPGMMNQQQQGTGIQWVTNAALNAVASATNGASPFKVYFKQQALVCIAAPTIFVLAATGVLAQIGFAIGSLVSNYAGSLI